MPTPTVNPEILNKLQAARIIATNKQPYLSMPLFSMVSVPVEGLDTFASDAKWRLYYDPAKVEEWPVEQIAGVLLHEVGHCLRFHATRFEALAENRRFAPVWNIAGDALINADLKDDGMALPEGAVYVETLVAEGIAAERTMTVEQIYRLLRDKQEESCSCDQGQQGQGGDQQGDQQGQGGGQGQQGQEGDQQGQGQGNGQGQQGQEGDQQGQGSGQGQQQGQGSGQGQQQGQGGGQGQQQGQGGGQGQPDPNCPVHGNGGVPGIDGWDCGSAADAVKRAYEQLGDAVDPGIDEDRADLIRQNVAVAIRDHIRNRGTVPAGYERWATELLEPVVDWRRELASIVRRSFAQVAGLRDFTYQRPSRRQAAMREAGQGIVLPAMRAPAPPKVAIVIDTSGSMSDDMLAWALSETQGVLRSLGSGGRNIQVITCDAKANAQRVTKISDVKLKGGGGTDMRVGINEAMEQRQKPQVVVVLSDGYTPWPSEPLPGGATMIVGLTDDGAAGQVPDWARVVHVAR